MCNEGTRFLSDAHKHRLGEGKKKATKKEKGKESLHTGRTA